MVQKLTTERFIEKSKQKHKNKYDYSLTEYQNDKSKVKIICPEHGIFEQVAGYHTGGRGCQKCGISLQTSKRTLSHEEFLSRLENKFPTLPYKIISRYENMLKQMVLEDELGLHKMVPTRILEGTPLTFNSAMDKTDYFIRKAKKVHGDTYNYDKSIYKSNKEKLTIGCKLHGEFLQIPQSHLKGCGCPICGDYISADSSVGWNVTRWSEVAIKSPNFESFKLYFVKLEQGQELFYKIGRTFASIDKRMKGIPYPYEIIYAAPHEDPSIVFNLETHIKRVLKKYRYKPSKPFGGDCECFLLTPEIISFVINEIKNYLIN